MSKTAIATLNKAAAIIATAGVNVDLIGYLNDGKARKSADGKKLWRSADKLAALIVNSAANAFQCENSETIKTGGNWFTNMAQAVEAYTMSNLDDWSQAEWDDVKSFADMDQLARLAEMVAANVAFEKREADHAEALEMDKQATHFRREQAALTERVRKIMGKTPTTTENVIPMNKAKAKQNQTPDNLPRLQLVDVVRAFLRTVPTSSQEQIEAVGDLSHKELRNLIIKMTTKGARVTAHLTKSKSAGYGFLTFGYNGQLPPGTYHKIVVSNMKNARDVASQYGAVMWNF